MNIIRTNLLIARVKSSKYGGENHDFF